MDGLIRKNKIIRKVAIISTKGNFKEIEQNAEKSIENCKKDAKNLAKQLNYSENAREFEIFNTHFACDFTDRPMMEKSISSVKEMVARATSYGLPAKYTYVIDGEYDKDGNKISGAS